MTMTPVYSLTTPGNATIEISQEELRSLLGQIETELHRSKVYRCALGTLQKVLGDSADHAKILFKAVGREAIALAFKQFAQQSQKAPLIEPQTDNTNISSPVEEEKSPDLSECLNTVKFHQIPPIDSTLEDNSGVADTSDLGTAATENKAAKRTPMKWLKRTKKASKAEVAKQLAVEQRKISLRQIGQQLREARELRRLSLGQLNAYTHVPIHLMEALENGSWDDLPEEVYVRGFIRVMGNAVGLNGTTLSASLPAPELVKSVSPSWYESKKHSAGGLELAIRPVHLYLGYTALVAGAVGGLSLMSQQANADKPFNMDAVKPSSSGVSNSLKHKQPVSATPGLKSNLSGAFIGPDIAPPETL